MLQIPHFPHKYLQSTLNFHYSYLFIFFLFHDTIERIDFFSQIVLDSPLTVNLSHTRHLQPVRGIPKDPSPHDGVFKENVY